MRKRKAIRRRKSHASKVKNQDNVEKKHKVTYDSSMKTGFVLHKADGNNHVFIPSKKGLYFSDVKNDTAHVMINTVDSIKNKYTVKEYADA